MIRRALALLLIVAVAGGAWWLFASRPPRPGAPRPAPSPSPVVPSPSPPPVPDPGKRQAAAVTAAFPRGTRAAFDDSGPRDFGEHRLVDAPFGPVLVSNGTMQDGPHAAGGMIAIHYLTAAGDRFTVQPGYPRTFELGSFGALSGWRISDAFSAYPVVEAEGGGTFQGYSCTTTLLIELGPEGPVEIAAIPTGYDDQGAVGDSGDSIEGRIGAITKGGDFTVRYTGTRSFAVRYQREGARFVARGGGGRMPTC